MSTQATKAINYHNKLIIRCETCGTPRKYTSSVIWDMIQNNTYPRFCSNACRFAKSPAERFEDQVRRHDPIADPLGCDVWTGSDNERGYPRFAISARRHIRAHRYAWSLVNGPLSEDQHLRHLCPAGENRMCVRVDHLAIGTPQDNADDRKRYNKPVRLRARLTDDEKVAMAELYAMGLTQKKIAEIFTISMTCAEKYLSKLPGLRSRKKKSDSVAA